MAAPLACDSLVALGSASADGAVWFAKNSDRPANECQPLTQVARATHAPGARLRCTYIEIPQAAETARVIGSRPYWCWGFEHGLNEHGVAIGNHTVFTKDPLPGLGLIGMDLVRLGLERARSAAEALDVMTKLIEHYGQGGSGYTDKDWPYHNSFLIADRATAFVLETSDRHWVARRIADVGSMSNHLTIGTDWNMLSDGTIEHAIAMGWWPEDTDARFDFAAAFRDMTLVPEAVSSGRHRRTCALLEQQKGRIDLASLRSALRDHYGSGAPPHGRTPEDPHYFSVCMHADPVGTTTASMIARLPSRPDGPLTYWASLGSPCVGAFVPLSIDADLPAVLTRGGEQPSNDSAWWRCKRLLTLVERDWPRSGRRVRTCLDAFETQVAASLSAGAVPGGWAGERTAFVQATIRNLLRQIDRLITEIESARP